MFSCLENRPALVCLPVKTPDGGMPTRQYWPIFSPSFKIQDNEQVFKRVFNVFEQ
jgi:hypothetical protein